jgi:hypothetical protein
MATKSKETLTQEIESCKRKASLALDLFNYKKHSCVVSNGHIAMIVPEGYYDYMREAFQKIAEAYNARQLTLEAELSKVTSTVYL